MSKFGLEFEIEYRIIRKLKKAGANSFETAVTFQEANLNDQEEYWLSYFAGVFLGTIKKTTDRHYYINSM